MKKAVVTISIGEEYHKLAQVSHPTLKAYADKVGADFIVWTDIGKHEIPHYRKLDLMGLLEGEYDRVAFIDTDIIIREDAPDLFEVVPDDSLGLHEEGRFVSRAPQLLDYMRTVGYNPEDWDNRYFNTGVIVASRIHKDIFAPCPKEVFHFGEQNYLNTVIAHKKPKILGLSYKLNRMPHMDKLTGEVRFDAYFIHYANAHKTMGYDAIAKIMAEDLKIWEEDKERGYKYRLNVALIVEGGLGDQICAEPVARFIRDKLYPGANFVITSNWPEIFEHLNVRTYRKGEQVAGAQQFYEMYSLRPPAHKSWEFMSHPLVHAGDFAALQSTRTTLPLRDKPIQLRYSLQDIPGILKFTGNISLNDLVLLHPGKGWPSKTFPSDVWQSYADILIDAGFKVAVIGKHLNGDQGIVEFDRSRCIDLIDKLSFKELVAIIAQAKVLITNDSAPVHVAGAFSNWIGLIATCKNPDFILPYRTDGKLLPSPYYKAQALERQPLYLDYNNQPSQAEGATIDKCTDERMRECLPLPEAVLDFVKKGFIE